MAKAKTKKTAPEQAIPHACPLDYPTGELTITCAGREIRIPKDPVANLAWRRRIIDAAEDNEELQRTLWALCADGVNGCVLWFNLFARCYVQKEVGDDGVEHPVPEREACRPFITWPEQDQVIIPGVVDAMERGHDLAVDKARQMGITVTITAVFLWDFLFHRNVNFEVLSISEESVDNPADPLSVFWKLDFILSGLPSWMTHGVSRSYMRIYNRRTRSSIIGRSTTSLKGRGGALKAVLFDEAAFIKVLETLWSNYARTTACRIANSTPQGPCYYSELVMNDHTPVLVSPWYNHPKYGRGRRMALDKSTGEQYVTSPYYAWCVAKAGGSRKAIEVAQELDRNHHASGSSFFDLFHLDRQRAVHVREPQHVGRLVYCGSLDLENALELLADEAHTTQVLRDVVFTPDPEGPLMLWCELLRDARTGTFRPHQKRTPIMGADVSAGLGASESTVAARWVEQEQKFLRYATAALTPTLFAREVALLGWWLGGLHKTAYCCPEANGGGGQELLRELDRVGYPWIMYREGKGALGDQPQKKLGWWSNRESKAAMLGAYRHAINTDQIVNPDKRALDQAGQYVRFKDGGIGLGRLEVESAEVRAAHGDIVIADALAWYGGLTLPAAQPERTKFRPGSSDEAMAEVLRAQDEKRGRRWEQRARRWATRSPRESEGPGGE